MQMRSSAVITAFLMILLTGQAVEGQFAIGGGPSFPLGTLGDEAKTGHHVQGSLYFELPGFPVDLRTDLFYQRFDAVEREPNIYVSLGGEWYRQLGFKVNAIYSVSLGRFEPYALVGGNWLREWHGDRTYSGTDHSAFSGNVGVGVSVPLNDRIDIFLEAPYLNLIGGRTLPTTPPAVLDAVQFKAIPLTIGLRV